MTHAVDKIMVQRLFNLAAKERLPMRGENIQYIYINSKHKNPLCRVVPVLKDEKEQVVTSYDKEKYRDLVLDAAETGLGYFGFNSSVYAHYRY
jgi:hypothetical protein